MHRFSHFLATAFIVAMAVVFGLAPGAGAQPFPFQTPTYLPGGIVGATTCAAACDVVFNTGGESTITVRVSGSGTGIAAQVQGTESVAASPTWSTLFVQPLQVGSATAPATSSAIAGVGVWRVNAAGLAQVRLHLTAVTGSVSVSMSGSNAAGIVTAIPEKKATYSAGIVALAPAASATDFLTLTGSATATVRVQHVECSGISTANATATIEALTRSVADTAGTPAAMTAVPHDTNDYAATATVTAYTANPTVGTLVGIVRAGKITTGPAASATVVPGVLGWDFNGPYQQEVVLRGIAQVFALNGAAASFSAGAALNCSVTWTEE